MEEIMKHLTKIGTSLLMAGIFLSTQTASAQDDSTLNMALSVDPDGLDPHRTTAASTFQITNNIFDTLVKVTPEGELTEGLATDWEISEDGLTITFNLRDDVEFHNGEAFGADDVLYSFERLKADESPRANDFANITEINVIDDYTIEFVTENLNASLASDFAYPWTAIVLEENEEELRNSPIGTGAYALEAWVPQQNLTLTKNENYFDEVHIDTVEFTMMPDATARTTAMLSGDLDIVGVTGDLVSQFEGNDSFQIIENQSNAVQLMAMNLENEFLSVPEVREAINLAVDKDLLIESVFWGYGEKIGSHYPPVLLGYEDHSEAYAFNQEKAVAVLEEAGFEAGDITLDMYLPSDYQSYVDAGQIIADSLENIGINVNIEVVEWSVWLSDIYTGRDYDLTVVGHTGRLDPYVLLARYHSESSENYFNYNNERIDELLTDVQTELDEDVRYEMFSEIQDTLAEEVPALYIQSPIGLSVTQANVRGYESYPIDILELKNIYFE